MVLKRKTLQDLEDICRTEPASCTLAELSLLSPELAKSGQDSLSAPSLDDNYI